MLNPAIKPLLKTIAVIAAAVCLVLMAGSFAQVSADNHTSSARDGLNLTCPGGNCGEGDGEDAIRGVVLSVVNVLSLIVGAVSVIMIILGGLRYVTSAGDASRVQAAKNTILYAIVGIVIVILAQAIVGFVVGQVEGGGTNTTANPTSSNPTQE